MGVSRMRGIWAISSETVHCSKPSPRGFEHLVDSVELLIGAQW
jgi:hypothetical protein